MKVHTTYYPQVFHTKRKPLLAKSSDAERQKRVALAWFWRMLIITATLAFVIESNAQYIEFVENKGQWDTQVRFKGQLSFGAIFLLSNGYKMALHHPDDINTITTFYGGHYHGEKEGIGKPHQPLPAREEDLLLRTHYYEVSFAGANSNAIIVPEKKLTKYNNYFLGNNPNQWASGCGIFQAVTYQNIYNGIDVRYYTDNGKVKYDFILKPGADINQIRLQFNGVTNLTVNDGTLVIPTSVATIKEAKPYSYTSAPEGRKEVYVKYVVDSGNIVRFVAAPYDKTKTLVIDPVLIFSAYSGSSADNWGYTATYDGLGNLYGGGVAFATGYRRINGIAPNQFQGGVAEGSSGGFDMAITKFSSNGSTQLYSTYLGGSGNEQPHSLVVDGFDLIIAGRSSSSNYPTTVANYGPGGQNDIVITRFNAAGTALVGSRRLGGTGDDGVNIRPKFVNPTGLETIRRNYGDDARSEVNVDGRGNILLATSTQSTDFPTTTGAPQASNAGGQDGLLLLLSSNLSNVVFATHFGGTGQDACFVLDVSPITGNIYVAGATTSSDLPGVNNQSVLHNTFQGGQTDGFIAMYNGTTGQLMAATYMGTNGNDMLYGIQCDKAGFVYIMGTTTVAWTVRNSPFNNNNNQVAGKQFVAKINPDLNAWVYSANFGKGQQNPDISPIAFLVDRCENVYVSGWGGGINSSQGYPHAGTNGMPIVNPVNPNYQGDGSDFYLFVLEKNAVRQLYGGLYGAFGGFGDHVDGGTSRFDAQGVIYHAVCSCKGQGGSGFPVTAGVDSDVNNSGQGAQCNLAVFKIALDFAGVGSGLKSTIPGSTRDTSGCVPLLVNFSDTIAIAQKYVWNFGDGSGDFTTTTPTTTHTFNTPGTFRVRLIAIDSNTCNIADTSFVNIRVRNDDAGVSFNSIKLLPCDSLKYEFVNTSVPPPNKPFRNNSFTWLFDDGTTLTTGNQRVTKAYASSGTYNVRLILTDTNYCNAPDTAFEVIRAAAAVVARFTTPLSVCIPNNASFNNISIAGQTFFWRLGDGTTSTERNPTHLYNTPGNYRITLIATDSGTCNLVDSTSFNITVSSSPTVRFSFSPNPPETNTPVSFVNTSSGGNYYRWLFGDGDSLVTTRTDTLVQHTYQRSATFQVCLKARNQFGCEADSCVNLRSSVEPLVDVASAFTPNGDGVNDVVRVRGFGITRMNWRIFNRWGQLVYQGTNPNQGWDGKYQGVLQAQDVFNYVLDLEFSDGTKLQKKGDITLLR
ncbi:MAG: PKD domain-containing protein [Chitinophagaceae bacterium]